MKFEVLKAMYESKQLTTAGLKRAVVLGFIIADQYKQITGEDYSA